MIIANLIRVINPKGKLAKFYDEDPLDKPRRFLWSLLYVNILEIIILCGFLIIFGVLYNFFEWAYYPMWTCIILGFIVIIMSILSPIICKIIEKRRR